MVAHVERFLLELGSGFAFVGRQAPLEVGGDDLKLDLVCQLIEVEVGLHDRAQDKVATTEINRQRLVAVATSPPDAARSVCCRFISLIRETYVSTIA